MQRPGFMATMRFRTYVPHPVPHPDTSPIPSVRERCRRKLHKLPTSRICRFQQLGHVDRANRIG